MADDNAQPADQGASGQGAAKKRLPAAIQKKYPDLEQLIVETESMTDEEREYWFQILPIMTDEQIKKLRGILVHEKEQLAKLDDEYEDELSRLNQKHILEWKEQERKEKRTKLKQQEAAEEKQETQAEADLLKQLEGLDDEEPPQAMAA